MPVRNPGLYRLTDADQLEAFRPVPEVYELQEVLYRDFQSFIGAIFQVDDLRCHFRRVVDYESLLNNLVARSPRKIIGLLLVLYEVPVNCDHWNLVSLADPFRHFLLTLRLLSERYGDLRVLKDKLHADARTFGVMDCDRRPLFTILRELRNPQTAIQDIDVLLVQRISELYQWDGAPASLEALYNDISMSRPSGANGAPGSISNAPSPQIVDVGLMISKLNQGCMHSNDIRRVLNEILRFT